MAETVTVSLTSAWTAISTDETNVLVQLDSLSAPHRLVYVAVAQSEPEAAALGVGLTLAERSASFGDLADGDVVWARTVDGDARVVVVRG